MIIADVLSTVRPRLKWMIRWVSYTCSLRGPIHMRNLVNVHKSVARHVYIRPYGPVKQNNQTAVN